LDSGSKVSLAVKTTIETASDLFKLFKEVWDFFLNYRHHKNKVEMDSMTYNFGILEKIKAAQEKGILTESKAQEYSKTVIWRTDDLIGLKVLPKQIVDAEEVQKNVELLQNFTSIKQLKNVTEEQGIVKNLHFQCRRRLFRTLFGRKSQDKRNGVGCARF
jgi:hypothetical protein